MSGSFCVCGAPVALDNLWEVLDTPGRIADGTLFPVPRFFGTVAAVSTPGYRTDRCFGPWAGAQRGQLSIRSQTLRGARGDGGHLERAASAKNGATVAR